jgi:hypothetical protein
MPDRDLPKELDDETVAVELPAGGTPVVRLAYSRDSNRLLAWDAGGVSRVFKLYDRMSRSS